MRALINMIEIAGMFIAVVAGMSLLSSILMPSSFIPMVVGDVIALAAAYGLYNLWEKRPIKLRCEGCGKIVLSNTPWVCGFCGGKNYDANEFSFLYKCGHCNAEPKSYKCHHTGCTKPLVFLTEDRLEQNYAYCLNASDEGPGPDEHAEELKKLREQKERKLEKRDIALVDEDLTRIRKNIRSQKEKKKKTKEVLQEGVDADMELEEAEAELKAAYVEKYKNNPAMLRRMNAALKASVLRQRSERM